MASAHSEELSSEFNKYGITASMLLSYSSIDANIQHLPELDIVTNEIILELFKFKDRHPRCTFKTLYYWIKDVYGKKWPEKEAPTCQAIARSNERLTARFNKLKKLHNTSEKIKTITIFLQEEYALPKLGFCKGQVLHFSPLKLPIKETHEFREANQKMYAVTRNANKRLKRRDETIQLQKDQIQSQQHIIEEYEKKLKSSEFQLSRLKASLDRVNHRASYWRGKAESIKHQKSTKNFKLCNEIESLREKVCALNLENAEMNETLESILSSEEISTFEKGRYTDDVRMCIYELLSLNVGVRNVSQIIRSVLKNIAHKSVTRLPSYGLTCQMILESLSVLQAHLGEKLTEANSYGTLQTDGTTKFDEHYVTYDVKVPDSKNAYTLGLRHIFSGSAKDTLEILKQILDDIDSVQLAIGKNAVSGKIVSKLKNTMSDRHSAEKLFNEMLQDYRSEILPTIAENWNEMTEIEKEQLTQMNNFFCGLHFIVGLADAAEETIKLWESQYTCKEGLSSSGTQRLVRTACKAFHHRGSQQCGSSTLFRTYLRKQGIHKIPLAQFVGNRFNVLFYDAAGVYYLRSHINNFIETVHGGQANRLLHSVLGDLKEPTYLSGCRALGLIDKLVSGPLWRKLQESDTSVIKMGNLYCDMKAKFDSWSCDAHTLLTGSDFLGDGFVFHLDDEVWKALVESNTLDATTQELLQLLFGSFSVTTQRLLIDHLPGGKHHCDVVSTVTVQETASVPTTNIGPERDFAVLDRMLREKPNANLIALESMILYSHNKTSLWLGQQTCNDRGKLLKAARTRVPTIRAKFKERKKEIEVRREEALIKKQYDNAQKEMKKALEKEKLTKEMEKIGLWTNPIEIEDGLETVLKRAEKLRLLKLQIKYRHKVLGQIHHDKSVFQFSHNKRPFSINQLMQNLCQLLATEESHIPGTDQGEPLANAIPSIEEVLDQPELLVGKKIKHRFEVDGELVWYDGTVLQMNYETEEFQVEYDGEDGVCSFQLLDDIASEDLLIL